MQRLYFHHFLPSADVFGKGGYRGISQVGLIIRAIVFVPIKFCVAFLSLVSAWFFSM